MSQLIGPSRFPNHRHRACSPSKPSAAAAVFWEVSPGLSGSDAVGLGGANPPVAVTGPLAGRVRTPGKAKAAYAEIGREPGPEALVGQEGGKNGRGATSNRESHLQSAPQAQGFVRGCCGI